MSQPVHSKPPEMAVSMLSEPSISKKSTRYKTVVEILSGGIGGASGIVAVTPFMYFKMYMQEKVRNLQNPPVFEKNPRKWFVGAKGLATWMFPQAAFTFAATEWMHQKLSNDGKRELTTWEKLACSSITGGILTLMVAPQELIWAQQKKAEEARLKMIEQNKLDPKKFPPKSATQMIQEIWKKHGIKGFYRAGGETAVREMVSASILTCLAAEHPFLAPVIGAAVSQPLDGRKTNKQIDFSYQASLRELFRAKAFSGLIVGRIPVYLVFMNVAPYVKNKCQVWAQSKQGSEH
jgi:hypothetical protein